MGGAAGTQDHHEPLRHGRIEGGEAGPHDPHGPRWRWSAMSEVVGRAGFHATHAKDAGDRLPALDEMMRSLDPERSAYWAQRNPNIVLADEHLNVELVNDGQGNIVPCTDRQQVINYGQSRLDRLARKITPDHLDKHGKKVGGTVTTSMLVAHLPKSMCVEIPNFYPRVHTKGKKAGQPMLGPDGEQLYRSRWVARDRDEARQYFADVREYLCEHVVPGGKGALLGQSDQFSESTPHGQFLFDTFADHPDKPGQLRVETSRAWFSHRDVLNEEGKQESGRSKLRRYHAGLKEFLIQRGYDISPDFDEERHMTGFTKDDYAATQDARAEAVAAVEYRETKLKAKLDVATKDGTAAYEDRKAAKADRQTAAEELESAKTDAEAIRDAATEEAQTIRRTARFEGYEEGKKEALDSVLQAAAVAATDREAARLAREAAERLQKRATQAQTTAEAQRLRLAELIAEAQATPPEFERFLDRPRKDGKSLRALYERETAQSRRIRARAQEMAAAPATDAPRVPSHELG